MGVRALIEISLVSVFIKTYLILAHVPVALQQAR